MNSSADVVTVVLPAEVTVTLTVPADAAGATAVISLAETTVKLVAFLEPNLTAVVPVNPDPDTVTCVPPAKGPEAGDSAVTVGLVMAVFSSKAGIIGL